MLKFFRLPFAVSGDKTAVPDASQPSGSVSYEDGFGVDYELDPGVDPAAKDVPRDETNQLFYDITNAIAELQSFGTPDFITSALNGGVAYSYSKYARVKYSDGFVYVSKIDANTDLPTVAASWWKLTDNANYLTIDGAVFEASVANGEAVYWDSANNRFDEAVADGTTKQNMIGFADVTDARVFVAGLYAGQLAGLTGNTAYYLSTVTPGALTSVASPVSVGIAKSATDMYVNVGASSAAASETAAGIVELATAAEIRTGADTGRVPTPAGLLSALGFSASFTSAEQTISNAGSLTIAHGLGRAPALVSASLICKIASENYAVGDVINLVGTISPAGGTAVQSGFSMFVDSGDTTNIKIRFTNETNPMRVFNKTTGVGAAVPNASWRLIIRAWG